MSCKNHHFTLYRLHHSSSKAAQQAPIILYKIERVKNIFNGAIWVRFVIKTKNVQNKLKTITEKNRSEQNCSYPSFRKIVS